MTTTSALHLATGCARAAPPHPPLGPHLDEDTADAALRWTQRYNYPTLRWTPRRLHTITIRVCRLRQFHLPGDPFLGEPPSVYCRGGIHGIGWLKAAGVGGCACGEKRAKNHGRFGLKEGNEMKELSHRKEMEIGSRTTFWKGSMGGVGMKVVLGGLWLLLARYKREEK